MTIHAPKTHEAVSNWIFLSAFVAAVSDVVWCMFGTQLEQEGQHSWIFPRTAKVSYGAEGGLVTLVLKPDRELSIKHQRPRSQMTLKRETCSVYNFDTRNVFCVMWSQEMATDAFLYAFIFPMGSRATAASGNFFLICPPNGGTPIQCCKASLCLWRTEDPNKQQAVLVFDSEHNGAAWGFGVSVRLEKSLGHALGVLDVVWHQSLLFGVWEWEAEVIDIRQASVLSLRGIGTWWREPAF